MKILGTDLETNSLNTDTCLILELGLSMFDTDTNRIMTSHNFIFKETVDNESEAIKINGLTQELLNKYGVEDKIPALTIASQMLTECDAVCAQNGGPFDRPILERYLKTYLGACPTGKVWIDTKCDIEYPKYIKSNSLVPLAAYHGFLNPFPHAAIFDIASMLTVLSKYNIEQILFKAGAREYDEKKPKVKVMIPKSDVFSKDFNEKMKERKYRWEPDLKYWYKTINEEDLQKETDTFPFIRPTVIT